MSGLEGCEHHQGGLLANNLAYRQPNTADITFDIAVVMHELTHLPSTNIRIAASRRPCIPTFSL